MYFGPAATRNSLAPWLQFKKACIDGSLNKVNKSLENDAIRNNIALLDNYYLYIAAENGRLLVVNRLLEFESVCSKVATKRNRAFYAAVLNKHYLVVERLLDFDDVKAALGYDTDTEIPDIMHDLEQRYGFSVPITKGATRLG
jgi:hypothetical protein